MLHWSAVFLLAAIGAAVFGFTSVAGDLAGIARLLFIVFVVLFVVSLFTSALRRG